MKEKKEKKNMKSEQKALKNVRPFRFKLNEHFS
jgi:hypothetical protein